VELLKNRIKKYNNELKVLKDLQIKTQREYFAKKNISKETDQTNMDKYEEKMVKIKEILPVFEKKLKEKKESLEKFLNRSSLKKSNKKGVFYGY
jgi:hypothetical protein